MGLWVYLNGSMGLLFPQIVDTQGFVKWVCGFTLTPKKQLIINYLRNFSYAIRYILDVACKIYATLYACYFARRLQIDR
jgi:hypothetical protein